MKTLFRQETPVRVSQQRPLNWLERLFNLATCKKTCQQICILCTADEGEEHQGKTVQPYVYNRRVGAKLPWESLVTQYFSTQTDMDLGSAVSAVRSNRVLVGQEVCPAVVVIKDGKIYQILSQRDFPGDEAGEVRHPHLLSLCYAPVILNKTPGCLVYCPISLLIYPCYMSPLIILICGLTMDKFS